MSFARPEMLWLLAAIALLAAIGVLAAQRARRALARFAGGREHLARFAGEVSPHRRAVKLLLLGFAAAAVVVALARPQWGVRLEELRRGGIDVVVVLDRSLSMTAADVAPSRLDLARHAIDSLLQALVSDRVALVSFSGRAAIDCPLTLDHGAVRLFLEALEAEGGPVGGTALADALRTAVAAFGPRDAGSAPRGRAIVLLSDGEDHEGQLEAAIEELARAGVAVFALGLGTTRGGTIPIDAESGGGYKKDREGRVVTTRLDESVLERVALGTGGRYYRASAGQLELEEIVAALGTLERGDLGALLRTRYEERFQIPLALAFLALLAETLIGDRARRPGARPAESGGPR